MSDRSDLTTLFRIAGGHSVQRWLCCPQCGGSIVLRLRRYCCEGNCRDSFATLAELAAKGETDG